ncbi:Acyl-CoA N-acyltransferase domain-containing protein [Strongyloides ratti]|uniref:Acyl-CoA N-acyltransferase domain-containing protein n=1 Tax=Strongyloides ratti TaxID=34506 RepID=A0A090L3M4_STRRB|nr:Acyl-CoA N-acyltransferase domain-containing protein [Strongyloides ratti]CEF62089.1 Acyl-CoA N-acyltransferase domain-containing protein [Strongyloides ratti]
MFKNIVISNRICQKFFSNNAQKLSIRLTTPDDRNDLMEVIKKGFHYDENLNNIFKLSYKEMEPIYNLILKDKFTINNSLVAVNSNNKIIGTIIILLKTKNPKYEEFISKDNDKIMNELVEKNEKIKTIFSIVDNSTKEIWDMLFSKFEAVYKSLILGVLPEYRDQKVGRLLMGAREEMIFNKYPWIRADVGICTTLKSKSILKHFGYHDLGSVSLNKYGVNGLEDGTTHVTGIYKIFSNQPKV